MTDKLTVRIVVAGLVLLALTALICTTVLIAGGHDASLTGSIATGAVGALAGILASTRTGADPAVRDAIAAAEDAGAAKNQAQGLEALITKAAKPATPARKTTRKATT